MWDRLIDAVIILQQFDKLQWESQKKVHLMTMARLLADDPALLTSERGKNEPSQVTNNATAFHHSVLCYPPLRT
jgi:hypothetical protein